MLSDRSILAALRDKSIILKPEVALDSWVSNAVQPASIDVTLGNRLILFSENVEVIDPDEYQAGLTYERYVADGSSYWIYPDEFILGTTAETLTINDTLSAEVTGKSSLARLGLMVHSTAGFIDPGFSGKVTLEIKNLNRNPIRLYPGMKIGQFKFFRLDTTCLRPYGSPGLGSHYQGQSDVTASRSWA